MVDPDRAAAVTAVANTAAEVTTKDKRSRLIDHSKRLYAIIVALAVADACRTLFPFTFSFLPTNSLVLFLTFLVTVVPIFQGFDRSLDIKYFEKLETPMRPCAYTWDVAMLILTAVFFLGMAESLRIGNTVTPSPFYFWLGLMLLFDCFVLLVDYLKTSEKEVLGAPYARWGAINFIAGVLILYISYQTPSTEPVGQASWIEWLVLIIALLRSGLDYRLSMRFLFPLEETAQAGQTRA